MAFKTVINTPTPSLILLSFEKSCELPNMFFPYKLGQQWTPSMSKSPNPNTYKIDPSTHTHISPHNFFSCLSITCQIIWPTIFIGIKKKWELLQVVSLVVMAFFIITFLNFKNS
jgi:hypothetical protein